MQPIFWYYLIYKSCGFCFLMFLHFWNIVFWKIPFLQFLSLISLKNIISSYIMGLEIIKYNWIWPKEIQKGIITAFSNWLNDTYISDITLSLNWIINSNYPLTWLPLLSGECMTICRVNLNSMPYIALFKGSDQPYINFAKIQPKIAWQRSTCIPINFIKILWCYRLDVVERVV